MSTATGVAARRALIPTTAFGGGPGPPAANTVAPIADSRACREIVRGSLSMARDGSICTIAAPDDPRSG